MKSTIKILLLLEDFWFIGKWSPSIKRCLKYCEIKKQQQLRFKGDVLCSVKDLNLYLEEIRKILNEYVDEQNKTNIPFRSLRLIEYSLRSLHIRFPGVHSHALLLSVLRWALLSRLQEVHCKEH